jgi:hypothetical protein
VELDASGQGGAEVTRLVEFLAMPTHCSRPHQMRDGDELVYNDEDELISPDCEHLRLTFADKTVECRSCGRTWKDMGTGQ